MTTQSLQSSNDCENIKNSEKTKKSECGAYLYSTCVKELVNINRLHVVLHGQKVVILVDTGSTINAISSVACAKLGLKIAPLHSSDYQYCTLANGKQENFLGTTSTDIQMDSFMDAINFYVLPGSDEYIIMGCPFLQNSDAIIDFKANCIKFGDAKVQFCKTTIYKVQSTKYKVHFFLLPSA